MVESTLFQGCSTCTPYNILPMFQNPFWYMSATIMSWTDICTIPRSSQHGLRKPSHHLHGLSLISLMTVPAAIPFHDTSSTDLQLEDLKIVIAGPVLDPLLVVVCIVIG